MAVLTVAVIFFYKRREEKRKLAEQMRSKDDLMKEMRLQLQEKPSTCMLHRKNYRKGNSSGQRTFTKGKDEERILFKGGCHEKGNPAPQRNHQKNGTAQ